MVRPPGVLPLGARASYLYRWRLLPRPGWLWHDSSPEHTFPSLEGRKSTLLVTTYYQGFQSFLTVLLGSPAIVGRTSIGFRERTSLRGPHSIARLDGGQETPSLSPLILLGGKVVRNIAAVFCQFWVPHQIVFLFPSFRVLLIVSCVISEF